MTDTEQQTRVWATQPLRAYVAGPLTGGNSFAHVHRALAAASRLRRAGIHPFVPHLYALWEMVEPAPYESWMELDLGWLECCDVLVRLTGQSPGSSREEAHAVELGIPVYLEGDAYDADGNVCDKAFYERGISRLVSDYSAGTVRPRRLIRAPRVRQVDPLPREPRTQAQVWAALEAFTAAVRAKLERNMHKAGWWEVPQDYLLDRLAEEHVELLDAVAEPDLTGGGAAVMDECVDVAAFAMMIFDNELEDVHQPRREAAQ